MSLYGYKKKGKPALWTEAFPEQVKSKPVNSYEPRRYAMSSKRRDESKEYARRRANFLAANPWCAVYPKKKSTDVHHMRGRAGALYLDTQFWVAVCRDGHRWIEDNKDEARKRGLLAQRGEWGKQTP